MMTSATTGLLCGAGLLLSAALADRPREVTREIIRVQEGPIAAVTSAPAEEIIVLENCPHQCRRCRKAEADIERLRATNPPGTPDLCVSYKVEIEDACSEQCLDLVLRVRHRRTVLLEAIIPLDHPNRVDDDERIYKGAFVDQLDTIVLEDRKHLRIEATVVDRNSERKLDREVERVRDHDHDRDGCIVVGEEIIIEERILTEPPVITEPAQTQPAGEP